MLISPASNSNLAAVHGQMCLCGNFEIQVRDCETPMEPKTKEGCFEKVDPCPGDRPTCGLSNRPGNSPCGLGCSLHQHHLPRDSVGVCLLVPGETGQPTSVLAGNPELACHLALAPPSATDPLKDPPRYTSF